MSRLPSAEWRVTCCDILLQQQTPAPSPLLTKRHRPTVMCMLVFLAQVLLFYSSCLDSKYYDLYHTSFKISTNQSQHFLIMPSLLVHLIVNPWRCRFNLMIGQSHYILAKFNYGVILFINFRYPLRRPLDFGTRVPN